MPVSVGIDLGTTNSVVSVYRRGIAETIPIDGRSTFPSVVSFREGGEVLAGQAAKSRLALDPENTVASAKRFIGDPTKTYSIGSRKYSPVDISTELLKRLLAGIAGHLGEVPRDVVITVPAYFTEVQREETKQAGINAGLNVLQLIPEPTAAAIAYGLDKGKDQTIMVYDLGGGTFDVSVLEVKDNRFQVKAVGGDNNLGGDDFDQAIVAWAAEKFKAQTGIDVMSAVSRDGQAARQRLKEAAEAAKMQLAQAERATISIPNCLGKPLEQEISIEQYNALIAPMLQRTVEHMRAVLRDAGLRAEDIDRVILVGGSTKNRAVREIVTREVKEPFTAQRVDEVVAHGAAIIAANHMLPDESKLPIEVSDVTAHSLGIVVLNEHKRLVFQALIPRQTAYPCRRGMLGTTANPWQDAVEIKVCRGEHIEPELNTYRGELRLEVSNPQEEQVPIAAVFHLDGDGIIHFTAVQLPDDHRAQAIIENYVDTDNLDVDAVDVLVRDGSATSKTVKIKS